jgi:hypothetical protein
MAVGSIGRRNTSIKSRSARVSKPKVSHDRSLSCRATRLNWERAPPAVPQLLLGHRVEPSTISSTHRPSTPSLASDITCCVPHTVNSAFDGSRIYRHKIDAGVTFFGRLLLRCALRLGVESVVLPFQPRWTAAPQIPATRRSKARKAFTIRTASGNLCLYRTAWWGWEDSNLQPSHYEPPSQAGRTRTCNQTIISR